MMIDEDNGASYDAQPPDDEMLSVKQAVGLLAVSRMTLYTWRKMGVLSAYKNQRGRVFYKKSDLLKTYEQLNSLTRI
jgi:predicted site-specific integrase-resolvase